MLLSASRPDMNIQAVKPLMAMPMPATIMTVVAATGSGEASRCTASQAMAPVATSSRTALLSAARMVVERNP